MAEVNRRTASQSYGKKVVTKYQNKGNLGGTVRVITYKKTKRKKS